MTNEWDNMADFWDEHDDVIKYSKKTFVSLNDTIDLKNKRVLDFGCGSGLLTEKIASKADAVFAMDTSAGMISVLKNKKIPNVTSYCDELSIDFIKKYAQELQTFDIIVASSVCAFLENYEEILTLLKSLLKPGGVFIQWDWLLQEYKIDEGFDLRSVKTALDKVGLSTVCVRYDFSLNEQKVLKAISVNRVN